MAPILFPVGLVVALVAVLVVRHQHQRSTTTSSSSSNSALTKARQITPPTVSLQKGGEFEHGDWWGEQDAILKAAWKEWWTDAEKTLPPLNHDDIVDPTLRAAVQTVRQTPTQETEQQLKSLMEPILTKQVYKIPFFTEEGVRQLRQHLDAASYYYNNTTTTHKAGIPTRRPNGMNRYGIIVDPSIEGAVSYDGLNGYMKELVDDYVRPLCRMLFPEITSRKHPEDDEESYAFTIRYRSDLDMALAEHSDACVYTININLNLPQSQHSESEANEKEYEGSSLYFVDPLTETQQHVSFQPGMAVLHRGQTRHAALPITQGERHNLVIWLFGRHAYVRIAEYDETERLTVQERWK